MFKIRNNGQWLNVNNIRIRNSNTWSKVKEAWIYSNGNWHKFITGVAEASIQQLIIGGQNLYSGIYKTLISLNITDGVAVSGNIEPVQPKNIYALAKTDDNYYAASDYNILKYDKNFNLNASIDLNLYTKSIQISGNKIYLGGGFSYIGGTAINNVIFTNQNNLVTNFNFNFNGNVNVMKISGNYLYLGGSFNLYSNSQGASFIRNGIVNIDLSTNLLTPWNPAGIYYNTSNVMSIDISGNNIFWSDGTVVNYSYAFYDYINNMSPSLNYFYNSTKFINTIKVGNSGLYVCANDKLLFLNSGGMINNNFNTSLDNSSFISSMELYNNNIYAVGNFTSVNSSKFLTKLTSNYNITDTWRPDVGGGVINTIAINGTSVYLGGSFTNVNSVVRNYAACVDTIGLVLPWNPNCDSYVNTIAINGTSVYLGGNFTNVNSVVRNYAACVDTSDQANVLPWDPNCNSTVNTIILSENQVYLGGAFTTVSGITRNLLACVDAINGNVTSWNTELFAGDSISSMIIYNNVIYVAGVINLVGNYISRSGGAAFDLSTGNYTDFNPGLTPSNDTKVYSALNMGLCFYTSSGALILFDYSGSSFNTFNNNFNNYFINGVTSVYVENYNVYVGGYFSNIYLNSGVTSGLCIFDSNGIALNYFYNFDNNITNMIGDNVGNIYIIGNFSTNGGIYRKYAASFDANTGNVTNWNPNLDNTASCIKIHNNKAILGGSFNYINGGSVLSSLITRVDLNTGINDSWTPITTITFGNNIKNIDISGNKIYAVGTFNYSSTQNILNSNIAIFDYNTGTILPSLNCSVNGLFVTTASYNNNIFYSFEYGMKTLINGVVRNRAACVDTSDQANVLPWDPNCNSTVNTIALSGNQVYLGGEFTTVNNITRNRAACVDTSDQANVLPWDPNCNSTVNTIALSGNQVYLGGLFTTVNGGTIMRVGAACVDTSDQANVLPWDPNCNSTVNTIALSGNQVYLGGLFTTVNGGTIMRVGAACIDTSGIGNVLPWNPNCNNYGGNGGIYIIKIIGSDIYLGGNFNSINSITRNRAACVDTSDQANVLPWNPNCNNIVQTLALSGNRVYSGGYFTTVNNITRNYAACVDTSDQANVLPWNPNCNYTVNTIALSGNQVYLGGYFTNVNSVVRNYAACVDTSDQANLLPWNPDCNSTVFTIQLSGNKVYLGGAFTGVINIPRNHAACITKTGIGNLLPWNPKWDSFVDFQTMKLSGNLIYLTGLFSAVCVDTSDQANVLPWNPTYNNVVQTMALSGNRVYLGGQFTTVNSITRNRAACVDTSGTGNLLPWNPNCSNTVNTITLSGNQVYLGGYFITVNSITRNRAACVDTSDQANLLPWNPNCDSAVYSIALNGNQVYLGGFFNSINNIIRNRVACVDTSGAGNLLPWNPNCDRAVFSITLSGNQVYLGGEFTTVNSITRNHAACVDTSDQANLLPWNPNCNSTVHTIALSGNQVYLGGEFTTVNSVFRNYAACVDTSNQANLLPWNPICNNRIYAIELSENQVYLSGSFDAIYSKPVYCAMCVDTSGTGNLLPWNPDCNSTVFTIQLSGNKVYLGGAFTGVINIPRNHAACVDTSDQANLLPWNPNCNNTVQTIALSGNHVYLGGAFTTVSGVIRNGVGCVDTSDQVNLLPWNPNSKVVNSIQLNGSNIYLGGDMYNLKSNQLYGIAKVDVISGNYSTWNNNLAMGSVIFTIL